MKSLQLDKPHAIVVVGIQGSGKTFFANKFSDTFSAPYFDEQIFLSSGKDEQTGKELMQKMITETAKTGRSIIVELALASRTERTELAKRLKDNGYETLLVWVQTDTDTAIGRSRKLAGISADEYKQRMKKFSPPHESEQALVISGKHTFASQAKSVLKKLTGTRPLRHVERPTTPPTRGQIVVR